MAIKNIRHTGIRVKTEDNNLSYRNFVETQPVLKERYKPERKIADEFKRRKIRDRRDSPGYYTA